MSNLNVLRLLPGVAQAVLRSLFHLFPVPDHVDPPRPTKMLRPLGPLMIVCTLFAMVSGTSAQDVGGQQSLELGRHVFLTYCSGCHGFDGLAFYPAAPSFAMGDRLAKSDAELLRSILKGKGAMPWWEGKLPRFWLEQALAYIRHMAQTEDVNVPSDWDGSYYIFTPLGTDPTVDWGIP